MAVINHKLDKQQARVQEVRGRAEMWANAHVL